MVTLKKIAQEAGVSVATVSLALRNYPRLSRATRAKVKRIAHRLGYRQNLYVSSLMRHIRKARPIEEKETIALVMATQRENEWLRPGPAKRTCEGAIARAQQLGYHVDFFWYNDSKLSPSRLNRILISRGIRGVLVVPFGVSDIQIDWHRFACATTNYSMPSPPIHRATSGFFLNASIAMQRLWDLGYRRVGVAIREGVTRRFFNYLFTAAYLRFMYERVGSDLSRMPAVYVPAEMTPTDLVRWYRKEKPDAILTMHNEISEEIGEYGIRVPEDVGIAILNHGPHDRIYAGVDPQSERIGATAIELVVDQLANNESGIPAFPKVVTIGGEWVDGPSVRQQRTVTKPEKRHLHSHTYAMEFLNELSATNNPTAPRKVRAKKTKI